jgi:hypothetical protein
MRKLLLFTWSSWASNSPVYREIRRDIWVCHTRDRTSPSTIAIKNATQCISLISSQTLLAGKKKLNGKVKAPRVVIAFVSNPFSREFSVNGIHSFGFFSLKM